MSERLILTAETREAIAANFGGETVEIVKLTEERRDGAVRPSIVFVQSYDSDKMKVINAEGDVLANV